MVVSKAKKEAYFVKLINLFESCPKVLIVDVDFVQSKQMQQIRIALRGKATLLMGKNTMIRTCLRKYMEENPDSSLNLDKVVSIMRGNLGFIFCHNDMDYIQEVVSTNRLPASAKAGALAQCDVKLGAGPTGLDPSQTNFFQTLNIPTKIVKGQIELIADQIVCKAGMKITASEAVLLLKMNVTPFEHGMELRFVYDGGAVFSSDVLKITDASIIAKFSNASRNIAALSREIGVPTEAALPHMVSSALKNMAALCADIDYNFPEIEKLKEFLANPEAFASAAAAAAPAAGGGGAAPAAAAAAAVEEEEEEEADFDLFG